MNKWLPFALLPLGLVLLCLAPCLPHDLHLRTVEHRFREVAHPVRSRSLAHQSAIGALHGEGRLCDYYVGELRAARLSAPELKAFYEAQVVTLEVLEPPVPPRWLSSPDDLLRQAAVAMKPEPGELLYLLTLKEADPPGLDWRCN